MAERANAASFDYLDTVAAVEKFTSEIARAREIALDTEGASFHRFVDRIYLLQLSTRDRHAVIDPLPIGAPAGLGALLEDPAVEVVFHDADYDLRLLQQDYGWHDPQHLRHAHRRAAARLHGVRARRAARALLRREARQEAPARRLVDASAHATTCSTTRRRTRATCSSCGTRCRRSWSASGRMAWAREEFALLEGTRWADEEPGIVVPAPEGRARPDPPRAGGAARARAVARRASPARSTARRSACSATSSCSRSRARSRSRKDALGKIKGMPRGILEQRGAELLDAVQRALAVPDAGAPEVPARRALGPRSRVRRARERAQDGARRGREAAGARSRRAVLARPAGGRRAPEPGDRRGAGGGDGAAALAGRRARRRLRRARWSRTGRSRRRLNYRVRYALVGSRSRAAFREPAPWVCGTRVRQSYSVL